MRIFLSQKKAGVVDIRDFRPFSLMGGVYKIISKVLANKPKLFWERLLLVPIKRSSEVDMFE
jgi:hypothetical protein